MIDIYFPVIASRNPHNIPEKLKDLMENGWKDGTWRWRGFNFGKPGMKGQPSNTFTVYKNSKQVCLCSLEITDIDGNEIPELVEVSP